MVCKGIIYEADKWKDYTSKNTKLEACCFVRNIYFITLTVNHVSVI